MRKIITLFLTILILLSWNSVFAEENLRNTCKEEIIENAWSPTFSPDWKSFAYILKKDGKKSIIKDWIELGKYKWIIQLNYTIDGKVFYLTLDETDNWWFTSSGILDWKEVSKETWGYSYWNYSWNLFYVYRKKIDILEWKQKEWTHTIFSKDLKNYYAVITDKDGEFILKDWIKIEKSDKIYDLIVSENLKSYITTVSRNEKDFVVKDWVEYWKEFDFSDSPTLSNDWKQFAYRVSSDWKQFIIKNWVEKVWYNYDNSRNPVFSSDWKSFAYVAEKDWRYFIVKDWVEWTKYDFVRIPIYSADWESFTYKAEKDWKKFLVKDWVEYNKYEKINDFKYFPEWKSFVYTAEKDWKEVIVKQACWNETSLNTDTINQNSSTLSNISKEKPKYLKQKILSASALKKAKQEKYISVIEQLVKKQNKEKLEIIYKNIWKVKTKYSWWNKNILDYLEAIIYLELNK